MRFTRDHLLQEKVAVADMVAVLGARWRRQGVSPPEIEERFGRLGFRPASMSILQSSPPLCSLTF